MSLTRELRKTSAGSGSGKNESVLRGSLAASARSAQPSLWPERQERLGLRSPEAPQESSFLVLLLPVVPCLFPVPDEHVGFPGYLLPSLTEICPKTVQGQIWAQLAYFCKNAVL